MMKTTLIGIPLDLGAENPGVNMGPDAFRYQKIVEKLTNLGVDITDAGNIECHPRKHLKIGNPKLKYLDEIRRVSEEVADKIFRLIQTGGKVVALGGDHSLCLGVVSGASVAFDGEVGLIYLDAHGDMNTTETTLTGNIHGMPLAALMGFGDSQLINVYKPKRKIAKENMLHIGGNDFDPGERTLIAKENLNTFQMVDMWSGGLETLFTKINELCTRVKNIWISLDLDVIDEMYAPGVSMPNQAGFTYEEIITIADYIGENCHVIGVDIDEYNPFTDVDGKTAQLGIELVAKVLGRKL